jgi:hypothetical protein
MKIACGACLDEMRTAKQTNEPVPTLRCYEKGTHLKGPVQTTVGLSKVETWDVMDDLDVLLYQVRRLEINGEHWWEEVP